MARVLATTPPYDHCNFTVLDAASSASVERFCTILFGMSYADPRVRPLLDLEGLKQRVPGRTSGYAALNDAVTRFGSIDSFVRQMVG